MMLDSVLGSREGVAREANMTKAGKEQRSRMLKPVLFPIVTEKPGSNNAVQNHVSNLPRE